MKITTENNKLYIDGSYLPCTSYEIRWNKQMEGGQWNHDIRCSAEQIEKFISILQPTHLNGDLNKGDKAIVWFSFYNSEIAWLSVTVITKDLEEKKMLKVISDDFAGSNWVKS